jgi:ABC-type amino acid transport substrate-binding protein/heat shock protein HslJ
MSQANQPPPPGEQPSPEHEQTPDGQKSSNTRIYNWLLIILGVLFVLALGFLLYLWFSRPSTEAPPEANVTPTTPAAVGDVTWERIQSAGLIQAGTSGDYAPFAYYNDSYQLDGFDVQMLRQIAAHLNLQIVINDIAFDGLYNAMLVNQIDLAAAGISVTSAREQVMDFSNIYYSSEDAYLANADSPITSITNPNDLIGKRIGVERGTVFESWVQETLIDPGLMPASDLLVYHKASAAVNDLVLNRIDVVILDLNPAQTYVAAGGVKLVGSGLNPQYYAIAMPKGADQLQTNINNALLAMQADGTMTSLIQQFFNQDITTPPPVVTPTPAPPQPTPTPQPCIDSMQFIADLSYNDQNMTNPPILYPGTRFVKGWRVRNNGTCTWDSGYILTYVGGNTPAAQMGGQPTPVVGTVAPGATYDFYVQLTAPPTVGIYQGFWQLRNPSGLFFGSRMWVGIAVSVDGTMPGTKPPDIQRFKVQPQEITAGQCVNMDWVVAGNVTNVTLQRNNTTLNADAPATGSFVDCPPGSGQMAYNLSATGAGGSSNISKTVTVNEPAQPTSPPPPQPTATIPPTAVPPSPPVINNFTVQPGTVNVGQCANMNWDVGGDPQSVRILRNGQVAFDNLPALGSGQDCFSNSGQVTYVLEASGQGQTVNAQQNVTVNLEASYELVSLADANLDQQPVLDGTTITMDINNNQLSGSAGCNNYNTTYALNGEELVIQPASATNQACESPEGIMEQESNYLQLLTTANRYNRSGNSLELLVLRIDPNTRQEVETVLLVYQLKP